MEIWSFFTGAMGLDLGLEKAGLKPTLAVEIDPVFCGSIRRNRPTLSLIEKDIAALTLSDLNRARRIGNDRPDASWLVGCPVKAFRPAASAQR
jgi:site-specific DNA-cytosine methylase